MKCAREQAPCPVSRAQQSCRRETAEMHREIYLWSSERVAHLGGPWRAPLCCGSSRRLAERARRRARKNTSTPRAYDLCARTTLGPVGASPNRPGRPGPASAGQASQHGPRMGTQQLESLESGGAGQAAFGHHHCPEMEYLSPERLASSRLAPPSCSARTSSWSS